MKQLILTILFLCSCSVLAQEYQASRFGIKSDGTTNNTGTINRAIQYIGENGGGELHFYVGRYLTGTIVMNENVKIVLHEGAVILGSTNPYDYPLPALIFSKTENKIEGVGVIDLQKDELKKNFDDQRRKGYQQSALPEVLTSIIKFDSTIIVK